MPLASTKTDPGRNRSPAGKSGRRPEVMSTEQHSGGRRCGLVRPMQYNVVTESGHTAHIGFGVEVLLVDRADLTLA